ncbi:AAA family ATPase [Desulfobacterales bacterium HSG16]|nr:AAA family ATPase [Desulfobacterales bacterium HSG16]
MKLQKLDLTNFRPFKKLNIEFGGQLTVLVGINGAGKTSILDALAVMLSRLLAKIRSPQKGNGRFFTDADIRKGAGETANSMEIEFNQETFLWILAKARRGKKKQTGTNTSAIKGIVDQIYDVLDKNEKESVPLSVFYGVNRDVSDVPLRIRTKKIDQFTAYDQALAGGRNDFRSFFEWYREREDFENEQKIYPTEANGLKQNAQYRDPQLQAVRKAVGALTDFSDLRIRRARLRMEACKNGQYFDVRQLSDGEKCLIALVGDLACRLAIANPGMKNPLDGQAIVLIDEIDLHLHPEWQHRVIPELLKTFPNCQFVLTTHSPQVLTHVRCKNIRCLVQMEQGMDIVHPDGTYGQDSNFLLRTLMRSSYRPKQIENDIHLLFELLRKDTDAARKLLNKLKLEIEGESPDLVRAQTLLHRREIMKK